MKRAFEMEPLRYLIIVYRKCLIFSLWFLAGDSRNPTAKVFIWLPTYALVLTGTYTGRDKCISAGQMNFQVVLPQRKPV